MDTHFNYDQAMMVWSNNLHTPTVLHGMYRDNFISHTFKLTYKRVIRDLAIYNSTVNCIHYLLTKIQVSLKMAPIEGAKTCSWD
jgi:hypothetical protein